MAVNFSQTTNYPFGHTTKSVLTASDASQAVIVTSAFHVIDLSTNAGSTNRTITVTAPDSVRDGFELRVLSKTAGTQTLTFSTGIAAPVLTGVAGKNFSQEFRYCGILGKYVAKSAAVQID
jgi:hypothetical protein